MNYRESQTQTKLLNVLDLFNTNLQEMKKNEQYQVRIDVKHNDNKVGFIGVVQERSFIAKMELVGTFVKGNKENVLHTFTREVKYNSDLKAEELHVLIEQAIHSLFEELQYESLAMFMLIIERNFMSIANSVSDDRG